MTRTNISIVLGLFMGSLSSSQSLYNNASVAGLVGEGLKTRVRGSGGWHSEVQEGNASAATSFRQTAARLADDFVVPSGIAWNINSIFVWGFQPGVSSPSITSGTMEIRRLTHDGATVATGFFTESSMTDIYRIFNQQPQDQYRCQKLRYEFNARLTPGKYWIIFYAFGIVNIDGPWGPYLTKQGELTVPGANAKALAYGASMHWIDIKDPGSFLPQDLPFWIDGTRLPVSHGGATRLDPLAPLLRP